MKIIKAISALSPPILFLLAFSLFQHSTDAGSLASFAVGSGDVSIQSPRMDGDFDHLSADRQFPAESIEEPSEAAKTIGTGVLVAVSAINAVLLMIFVLTLIFRWKKSGVAGKFILSGCSLILLITFVLSAVGVALVFFYMGKDKTSSDSESGKPSSGDPASALKEEMPSSVQARTQSEEEIAKFAFEKFNNAVKLYQDYQKNFDPDIYKKAIWEIELALEADQSNPAYWLLAGKIYSEVAPDLEVQVTAETYLRKSLELDPKNLQTILTLANCLSLQDRYHEAAELFTKALSRDYYAHRDYLVPIITYTYIYDYQYEKAERFLRSLLDSDPGSEVIRISLAVAMNMQGEEKAEDAKTELRKVIAKADSPPLLKTYASNLLKNFDKWHDKRFAE